MKKCTHCGAELEDEQAFCLHCFQRNNPPQLYQNVELPPPSRKKPQFIVSIGVLLAICLFSVSFFHIGSDTENSSLDASDSGVPSVIPFDSSSEPTVTSDQSTTVSSEVAVPSVPAFVSSDVISPEMISSVPVSSEGLSTVPVSSETENLLPVVGSFEYAELLLEEAHTALKTKDPAYADSLKTISYSNFPTDQMRSRILEIPFNNTFDHHVLNLIESMGNYQPDFSLRYISRNDEFILVENLPFVTKCEYLGYTADRQYLYFRQYYRAQVAECPYPTLFSRIAEFNKAHYTKYDALASDELCWQTNFSIPTSKTEDQVFAELIGFWDSAWESYERVSTDFPRYDLVYLGIAKGYHLFICYVI